MRFVSYNFNYYNNIEVFHYIPTVALFSANYKNVNVSVFTLSIRFLKFSIILDIGFDTT
jgi:hypothetical protein